MKKLFFSLGLIGLGAGMWWATARTARFSIKKWDAKFETVVRHNLSVSGLADQDVLSSVHEIRKDKRGEWVAHRLAVKIMDAEKRQELVRDLENSGAKVDEAMDGDVPTLTVRRGSRVYQEIRFLP